MAIIDLVRWSPQGDETIFAWRFPHTNLSTYTQLIVQESQEAVLFSKGQIMGKFGPGKHTLNTENLPILRSLYGIPFGGKNPFTAEVWFVNRIQTFSIDWYIDRMAIHDADYNTQLPLTASGQYGLQVTDAEKFLVKIVGTRSEYTQEDLTEQFTGEFTTKTKSTIVQYMLKHRVGFKQISAYLDMLSEYLRGAMNPFWDALGLRLNKFYVSTIDISDATPEDRRVKEAISQQAAMSITGHTWQQEQMFDTAKSAIGGLGDNTGGLLGGLLCVFGMCMPPMVVLIIISFFYQAFRTNYWVMAAMEGMQAAVVPIILGAAVGLAKGSVQYPPCYVIVAVCLALYLFTSLNPIVLVLIGVVSGLIVGTAYAGKEARSHGAA